MIFVDTNIIVDVVQGDQRWASWSIDRLDAGRAAGGLLSNSVVVAELSRDYADLSALRAALRVFELSIEPLDERAAFMAGRRFVTARRGKTAGERSRPLPDFFIGAHALTLGATLLTRDTAIYRRHFPDLALITPETHP